MHFLAVYHGVLGLFQRLLHRGQAIVPVPQRVVDASTTSTKRKLVVVWLVFLDLNEWF